MKALITGASSGIGYEISKYLSRLGYECVLVARREERLRALSEELETPSTYDACDITLDGECERLFERHPEIDLFVNCAGCGVFGAFHESDIEREKNMLKLNVVAPHILTKLYLKAFLERGNGRILNIGSSAGFFSGPLFSSYYASKAYLLHLTEAVSWENRKKGISVSLFCPGPVATEFGKADGISDGKGAITPELAAKRAVDGALKGKRIIYPNLKTRALVFSSRLLPRALLLKIVEKQQANKR